MENLFLRFFIVSLAVSALLLPLLLLREKLERRYAPQTRWGLWLAIALVLLIAPWIPRSKAPVVVTVSAYQVSLPAPKPQKPVDAQEENIAPMGDQTQPVQSQQGQGQPNLPVSGQDQTVAPAQGLTQAPARPDLSAADRPIAGPAAPVSEAAAPTVSLTLILSALWLFGTVAVLLWQSGRYLLLRRRLLKGARPVEGLEHYALELELAKVDFYQCKGIPGPMTLGIVNPVVLLPEEETAPAALRHELYHIKRHDVTYKNLLLLTCAVHWFNPLVWIMARRADRDVEACCDAAVVAHQDAEYKRAYGELLLASAAGERPAPFTTHFGGGKEQMKSRLTQLFCPGKKSWALVCVLLAAAVLLSSLVACRKAAAETLADGIYCVAAREISWPVGEPDAEGEDYGSIRLTLCAYDAEKGPGEELGEYTLPFGEEVSLWEDTVVGQKGTEEWKRAVEYCLHWPYYRNSIPLGDDLLLVEVKDGQTVSLCWTLIGQDGENILRQPVSQPLTANTMPNLDYYDQESGFLVYHTRNTLYFHYGDSWEAFYTDTAWGTRVLTLVRVSADGKTVYFEDSLAEGGEDLRFYRYDVERRETTVIGARFEGKGEKELAQVGHVTEEELHDSGFSSGLSLRSNVIKTADGTMVGLWIDEQMGNTIEYLRLKKLKDNQWVEGSPFLTPEKISAPRDYTEPEWGFTLRLPESMEGNYVVSRAANNWNFYAKDLYPAGRGYLFSLWAEDSNKQGEGLKEKDGVTYLLTLLNEKDVTPEEQENKTYMAMLRDSRNITADDLDLTGVTRSGGYLWPLPYTEYGSDRLLGEENNTLRILSPEGMTVQAAAGGKVVSLQTDPSTGAQTLILSHPDGWYTEYGHLEYVQVAEGADLKRGDILGFPKTENGRPWLSYRLLGGGTTWDTAAVDPWSVEYRTYDFLPVTHNSVTIAGDPAIENTLQAVLRGELSFYDTERGTYRNVTDLGDGDGVPVSVYRYAQLDMDNDSIPELVLWLQRGENPYQMGSIILRYQNGVVHGYPMGFRSMNLLELKRDGTYSWSGSAFYNGWGRKDFYRNETINTLRHDYDKYYQNGASITEETYVRAEANQSAKPDVVWYQWGGGAYFTLRTASGRYLEVCLLTKESEQSYFPVHRIEVYEGNTLLQTIDTEALPQPESYAWDGCFVNRGYTVGEPIVKDLNFDGSQDFGLLAVESYPHNVPYNYFLWDEDKNGFIYGFTLFSEVEADWERRELTETEYSMMGNIQNRYVYKEDGSLEKVD